MAIYFFSLFIYIFLYFVLRTVNYRIRYNYKKITIIMFVIIFGCISGLRSQVVGVDTGLYNQIFFGIGNQNLGLDIFSSKYPLYWLYNWILYQFSNNAQVLIFINSMLISIIIGYSLYRLSSDPFFSSLIYITLYFYFNSMNITRQFISMSLIVLAITFLFKSKTILFWILFIMAVLVHNVAIISLPLIFLYKINWNNKKTSVFLLFIVITSISYNRLISIFLKLFPQYNLYTQSSSGVETLSSQSNGGLLYVYLLYLLFAIIGFIYIMNMHYSVDKIFIFLDVCVLFSSILGITLVHNILINRVLMYYLIFVIFFIPLLIEKISIKLNLNYLNANLFSFILKVGVFLITMIPMSIQLYRNISGVNPYVFLN